MLCASLSTSSTVSLSRMPFPQFFSTSWALQRSLTGVTFSYRDLQECPCSSARFVRLEVASWSVSLASVTNASFSFRLRSGSVSVNCDFEIPRAQQLLYHHLGDNIHFQGQADYVSHFLHYCTFHYDEWYLKIVEIVFLLKVVILNNL